MLLWNDVEADEKIKVYDKGVQMNRAHRRADDPLREGVGFHELLVSYRAGDMWAPRVDQAEALKLELSHFITCITKDHTPINDGAAGARVVKILEAADRSLKERGKAIAL
jgi:hypothetical protein